MKKPKVDNSGAIRAEKARQEAEAAAERLRQENLAQMEQAGNVVAGGTAIEADNLRKRRPTGLASTLGIQA